MSEYRFEDIQADDEEYVLHTYARTPIAFVRGENARLYDSKGNEYIDFGSGIAVCSVGHGNERLARAISIQAHTLMHTSNLYYIAPQATLARKLVGLYNAQKMRVFFANSGAEANECAIKIARKYGEKNHAYKIITLDSSFHGRTLATLTATAQSKMHKYFAPFLDGFIYAKDISDIYNHLDDGICAVMLELIQGEGGILPMPRDEIIKLEATLKKKNILLIIDEVQSGIYRSGELFASQVYGIQPEIITTAKGLAGGVPIGAVMTSLRDIFEHGDHGSTFGGNFLSTSAALEVLEILHEMYRSGEIKRNIEFFHSELDKIVLEFRNIFTHKVGLGLMCGLVPHKSDMQPEIIHSALEHRLIVLKSGKGVLRFLPALTITQDEICEGFARLHTALKKIS